VTQEHALGDVALDHTPIVEHRHRGHAFADETEPHSEDIIIWMAADIVLMHEFASGLGEEFLLDVEGQLHADVLVEVIRQEHEEEVVLMYVAKEQAALVGHDEQAVVRMLAREFIDLLARRLRRDGDGFAHDILDEHAGIFVQEYLKVAWKRDDVAHRKKP